MLRFAINHMTIANASFETLLDVAVMLGCEGVEIRTDLTTELFDGISAQIAGVMARERGLRILALAEITRFNDSATHSAAASESLMATAAECGAEAISLIPCDDGQIQSGEQRKNALLRALETLKPLLQSHDLVGLIEPLGFESSSLRSKREAVEGIEALNASGTFKLIHDTFHHTLAGDELVFPEYTGLVHVSGVIEPALVRSDMRDEHRVLVTEQDRLGNVRQLSALRTGGYSGPVSMEAFSPLVHRLCRSGC